LLITFGDLFDSDGNPSTVVVPLEKISELLKNTSGTISEQIYNE